MINMKQINWPTFLLTILGMFIAGGVGYFKSLSDINAQLAMLDTKIVQNISTIKESVRNENRETFATKENVTNLKEDVK